MSQLALPTSAGNLTRSTVDLTTVRRRRDLRFQQTGHARWNVLDPISRQSYRVGMIEHWLLTRPDGKLPLPQLLANLRREYPELPTDDQQLLATVLSFKRNGLLIGTTYEPLAPPASGFWQAWLGSMVVWQIRGIQPDRWLGRLVPHTGALLSATAVRCWLALSLFTLLLVLLDFRRLAAQSLSFDWILHPATGGWLFIVFIVTRGLHELGHALACKRFGVRCPDIGLFVILGAPCVYCDVSESWQLPRRWQRAAVAGAGMYVELVVATVAAWLWLATVPGAANTLALQTMLVCSISTLAINANPLMRFDGYYILADWLDEVNLRGKADMAAGSTLHRWLLGSSTSESTQAPAQTTARARFLLAFSIAGWIYRAMLSVTVASVLVAIYAGWNLPWIGRIMAAAILISWWGVPAVKLTRDLVRSARQQRRSWRLALVAAVLVIAATIVPLPSRRLACGWLQPLASQGVFVGNDARLSACAVRDGETVEAGKPLFQLQSHELSTRLVRYQQANQMAAIRLEASRRQRDMHNQDVDVEHYAHQLEETDGWLDGVQREMKSLTLSAPIGGRLVAMTAPVATEPTQSQLGPATYGLNTSRETAILESTNWCDAKQIGRFIPQGSLLASICSDQNIAVIPLTEQQLSSVAAGTPVRLRIADQSLVLKDCQVKSVVQIDELASPWQSAALASITASQSQFTTVATSRFAAVVDLPSDVAGLPGSTVDAVFVGSPTTLATLAVRWMHANLRLFAD